MGQLIEWLKGNAAPNDYVEVSEDAPFPVTTSNISLQKSIDQKYFIGQTESLTLSTTTNGYAELFNPSDSGINVHVNVWTVSNTTASETTNFVARMYFGGETTDVKTESTLVTSTNLTTPVSIPKAKIRYVSNTASFPSAGLQAFTRRIPGIATIVDVEDGKFIIPPGKAFSISLTNGTASANCRVAFGWWEKTV